MPQVRKLIRIPIELNRRLRIEALTDGDSRDLMIEKALAVYAAGTPDSVRVRSGVIKGVKVKVDSDVWEAALGRARLEGKALTDVLIEQLEDLYP